MKYMYTALLSGLFLLSGIISFGQSVSDDYKEFDDYVRCLGTLDTLNMRTICYVVSRKFSEAKDHVRAIFDWITNNISFDLKAGKNNDNEKINTGLILISRKANAAGYAALFQDMCSA